MKKYIKFKGKFKDLIPDGWTFQKLYARNYRQYHKTCDGQQYTQGCRIWQHLGGYLEVADLGHLSYLVVEGILSGELTKRNPDRDPHWLILDMETEELVPINYEIHKRPLWDAVKTLSDEDLDVFTSKFYDKYREFNLRYETVDMLKDLLDKGWISIEEGNVYH